MESKSHFLAHFIPGILLGSVVGLAFGSLLVAGQIPRVVSTDSTVKNEVAVQPEAKSYAVGNISFNYPAGWHVMADSTYDDTKRTLPAHEIYINPEPIHFVSPSDFSSVRARVRIHATDEDEAILAPYESDGFWKEQTSDQVVINGATVKRLRLSVGDDSQYSPLHQEVLFFTGHVVTYEYGSVKDAEDPSWLLIQESLRYIQ